MSHQYKDSENAFKNFLPIIFTPVIEFYYLIRIVYLMYYVLCTHDISIMYKYHEFNHQHHPHLSTSVNVILYLLLTMLKATNKSISATVVNVFANDIVGK